MAKDVRQKFTLDASQARQAIKSITTSLTKYNAEVKKVSASTKEQNKELVRLNPRLQKLNEHMRTINREASRLARAYTTQTTKVREAARAAASASRSMGTLAGNTRSANSAMRSAANSATTFATRFRDAGTNMARANRHLRNSATLLGEFNRQIRRIIRSMAQKDAGLIRQTALHRRHNQAMRDASRRAQTVVISWQSIARIIATTAVHRVALRLAQAFLRAREEAQEFSIRIGEIKTIEGEAAIATERWRNELVQLSNIFGFDVVEAAEGAYQALSNQVVEAGNTAAFMSEEMRLARTAVTTLGEAVSATTSVLNAWGMEADHARTVNSVLMATVERGRLRLEDLANTIGRVNVLSAELGVSVIEQNAAIALLTRQGVRAEEAITYLRNVMLKLIKPTDYMSEKLRELGIESGAQLIAAYGLAGAMEQVGRIAKDGGDELAELGKIYGRIRATVGGVTLATKDYRGEIDELIKSTADYENKTKDAFETTGRELQIQFQRAQNVLVDWGDALNETMLAAIQNLGGLDKALIMLKDTLVRGAQIFASYVVASRAVVPAITAITASLRTGTRWLHLYHGAVLLAYRATMLLRRVLPVLLITAVIDQVIQATTAMSRWSESIDTARSSARALWEQLGEQDFDRWAASSRQAFLQFNDAVTWTFRQFHLFTAGVRKDSFELEVNIKEVFKKISESIRRSLAEPLKAARDEIRKLATEADDLRDDAESREKDIVKRRFEGEEDAFRAGLVGKTEEEKIRELNKLKINLNRQALVAMSKDDIERADMLFKKVEELQRETTSRVRALYDAASKKEDVELEVRRRVRDPLTGRRRTITDKVKVGEREKDPAEAARTLTELNRLEAERKRIVDARIAAETEYIKRKEAEAAMLEKETKSRETAFNAFKGLLSQLDAFDVSQEDALKKFNTLVAEADKAARAAGLDPKARLEFLRQAYAQRLTLARESARRIAKEELDIAEGVLKKIEEMYKNAVEERQGAITGRESLLRKEAKPAIEELRAELNQMMENLMYHGRFQPGEGGVLLVGVAEAAEKVYSAFEKYQDAKTPQALRDYIAATRELNDELQKLDKNRDVLKVQGVLGFYQQAPAFKDSLKTGERRNIKIVIRDFLELQNKLIEAQKRIDASVQKEGNLEARLKQIRGLIGAIPEEYRKVVTSSKEAAINSIIASRNTVQALQWVLNKLEQVRRKHAEVAAAAGRARVAGGFAHGGTYTPARHFAMGGAQGIDRYPAFLAEGETVMTQLASSQFAPLLHAMNAAAPATRASQGAVSFGDIHITVPEGTSDVQIDTIIRGLQRRARQGLLNL